MRTIDLDKQYAGMKLEDLLQADYVPLSELRGKPARAVWDMSPESKKDAVFMLRVTIDGKQHDLFFFKSQFQRFLRSV